MLDATHIAQLQDQATTRWHEVPAAPEPAVTALDRLIVEQHRANFDLWHREDDARDPDAEDAEIVRAKRDIDALNQRRNDLVEQIDVVLLEAAVTQMAGAAASGQTVAGQASAALPDSAALHSETPGLMIDRLSILALKRFHTAEEACRKDASAAHHQRNRERLARLTEQRDDLAGCLAALWTDVLGGRRRFKLYRQFKMYNDPDLNPVLYNKTAASARS